MNRQSPYQRILERIVYYNIYWIRPRPNHQSCYNIHFTNSPTTPLIRNLNNRPLPTINILYEKSLDRREKYQNSHISFYVFVMLKLKFVSYKVIYHWFALAKQVYCNIGFMYTPPIVRYLKNNHPLIKGSLAFLGAFFMMSTSGGLKLRAVAGGPSVIKFTHNSCTGINASGIPKAAVRKMLRQQTYQSIIKPFT